MKKKLITLLILLLIPLNVFAISKDYKDVVYDKVNVEKEDKKINLYLFHGEECPHCEKEREWLEELKKEYKDYLNIYEFEVWHNDDNAKIMKDLKKEFKIDNSGVPFTIVGEKTFVGFSDVIESKIENTIKSYAEIKGNKDEVKIPLLGKVDMKKVSIPLVAVVLGFIDGFNPCAMWILLFLISMLFGMKDRKRSWILGFTFLFMSGLIYFLSMIGINFVLGIVTIKWMKIAIAIFILVAGILNLRKYFKMRKKDDGCSVVDSKKRKKIMTRMRKVMESKSFVLSLVGISILGISVNLIELACSLGFPVVFNEMLTINNITGMTKIIYLLIYILFYMIDDLAVFIISMITLEATGITNKYNKLCTIVSAIIMIIMGVLLLIKPEWLMLNF